MLQVHVCFTFLSSIILKPLACPTISPNWSNISLKFTLNFHILIKLLTLRWTFKFFSYLGVASIWSADHTRFQIHRITNVKNIFFLTFYKLILRILLVKCFKNHDQNFTYYKLYSKSNMIVYGNYQNGNLEMKWNVIYL